MMEEIWKPIKGYEDRYQVSNFGRVRSKDMVLKQPGCDVVLLERAISDILAIITSCCVVEIKPKIVEFTVSLLKPLCQTPIIFRKSTTRTRTKATTELTIWNGALRVTTTAMVQPSREQPPR